MNGQTSSNTLSAAIVAILLVLTAWGNAIALLLVSVATLVVWIVVNPQDVLRRGAAPAAVAAAVAAGIAVFMLFR
jgi:hypothetical protein